MDVEHFLALNVAIPKIDRVNSHCLIHQKQPNLKVMIPLADYPTSLVLLSPIPPPGILSGNECDTGIYNMWIYFFSDKCQLLISKYGLHEWATNSVDLHCFARMLAKIAHGYTVGELGINGFDHILPELILGKCDDKWTAFVGGARQPELPRSSFHEISGSFETVDQTEYIVIRIRLFSNLGAPTYI
ncbi:MAG: hypothetical protein WA820_24265, partial [Bradyrhizobium sp.]